MTIFLQDDFSGAAGNLTGTTPDVGSVWQKHTQGGELQLDGAGAIVATSTGFFGATMNGTPPSRNYSVSCTVRFGGSYINGSYAGVILRTSNTSLGVRYWARILSSGTSAATVQLYQGTSSLIGSFAFTAALSTNFTLECIIDGVDIVVKLDGTTVITRAEPTDQGPGLVGVTVGGGLGLSILDVVADSLPVASASHNNLVCEGDSITTSGSGTAWPTLIQPALTGKWLITNISLASDTLNNMNSTAAATIDVLYDAGYGRNVVTIFAGTNDLFFGANFETTRDRMITFIEAREAVGWEVIPATMLKRSGTSTPALFETYRGQFNDWLRTYCSDNDLRLADVANDYRLQDETSRIYFSGDNIHPGTAGNNVTADLFSHAINRDQVFGGGGGGVPTTNTAERQFLREIAESILAVIE